MTYERRSLSRVKTKDITVRLVSRTGQFTAKLTDLTATGAGFTLHRHLRSLEPVTAIIILNMGDGKVVKVHHRKGRIAWCKPIENGNGEYRLGMAFLGLD